MNVNSVITSMFMWLTRQEVDEVAGRPEESRHAPRVAQTIAEQNFEHRIFDELGIVNGTPGSITSADVYARIAAIENSDASQPERYAALDACRYWVANNHPDGITAYTEIEAVNQAIDRVIDEREEG